MATTTGSDEVGQVLAERIAQLITDTASNAPRSLQKRIGPSGVGNPCERAISYLMLDWPKANTRQEVIAPVIGTGFHSWMEEAFEGRQATLPDGRPRYRIEERVTVRDSPAEGRVIAGSSDLYDRATGTVWDWKLVGKSSLEKYRRGGPGDQYRIQAHLYGLGQENAGETPQRVAICFVGRYHQLLVHVWTEPYNRQVALDALARLDHITDRFTSDNAEDTEFGHSWWTTVPTSPKAKCMFCEWYKPGSTDLAVGCPGNNPDRPARAGFESLIA
ncbi:hypothetical protein ABZ863_35680 [Saccharomonospora sp. NPDC046836]|uniref:hypothetical protein n=1 Tax=Saccharomonospora sp. NPDC046836 TaxID=3156921 RepID=UPI0033C4A746